MLCKHRTAYSRTEKINVRVDVTGQRLYKAHLPEGSNNIAISLRSFNKFHLMYAMTDERTQRFATVQLLKVTSQIKGCVGTAKFTRSAVTYCI